MRVTLPANHILRSMETNSTADLIRALHAVRQEQARLRATLECNKNQDEALSMAIARGLTDQGVKIAIVGNLIVRNPNNPSQVAIEEGVEL